MRYLYFGNPISFVYFLLSFQVLLNMLTGLWHIERKQGERSCFINGLGFRNWSRSHPCVPGTGGGSLNSSKKILRSRCCLSTNAFFLGISSRVHFWLNFGDCFPGKLYHFPSGCSTTSHPTSFGMWTLLLSRGSDLHSLPWNRGRVLTLLEVVLCVFQG